MKKAFLVICGLIALSLSMQSFKDTPQKDGTEELSPFVGTWDWEKNSADGHTFVVWIGERNDSLLFTMGGIFFGGRKIHLPEKDQDRKRLQMIRVKKSTGRIIKSKISEGISNAVYNLDRVNNFNNVTFELINDSVMQFLFCDTRSYWPDTAIMVRRDNRNIEFSDEAYYHIYNGE